jgi:hypothetical protein
MTVRGMGRWKEARKGGYSERKKAKQVSSASGGLTDPEMVIK